MLFSQTALAKIKINTMFRNYQIMKFIIFVWSFNHDAKILIFFWNNKIFAKFLTFFNKSFKF